MDYYQQNRKRSYVDFMNRVNRRRSSDEQDIAFMSCLKDSSILFGEHDLTEPVSPGPVIVNEKPSPFTSEASSLSDDEPEPNQEDDSDDDDLDPAAQFMLGVQEQYVVIDGRSYPKGALPSELVPSPVVPAETSKVGSIDDMSKFEWTLDSSLAPTSSDPQSFPFINPFAEIPVNAAASSSSSPSSSTSPNSPSFSSLPSKRSRKALSYLRSDDEDDSGARATEDEYRPSPSPPPIQSPKRRRVVGARSNSPCSSSTPKSRPITHRNASSSKSSSSSPKRFQTSQSSSSSLYQQIPSRNKQSSNPMIKRLAKGDPEAIYWLESLDFVCSECGWVQISRRMPDFQRHMNTHNRPDQWCCKGVLVKDRDMYPQIPGEAPVYQFAGQWRVGGCLKTFSRRDALTRHLCNANVGCFGKACKVDEE